jgi:hypothetical protein
MVSFTPGGNMKTLFAVFVVLFASSLSAQTYPQMTPSTTNILFQNSDGTNLFPGQSASVQVVFTISNGPIKFQQTSTFCQNVTGNEYTSECDDVTMNRGCYGTWQNGETCTITYTFSADGDDQGCNPLNPNMVVPAYGCTGNIQVRVPNNPNYILINYTALVDNPVPQIAFSSTSLQFPATKIGEYSTLDFNISNIGNLPLTLGIGIANGTPFTQTNNCPNPLPVQQTCNVNVTFTPTAAGTSSAKVGIMDNDTNPNATKNIQLNGVGTND